MEHWTIVGIVILVLVVAAVFVARPWGEDRWIKDSRGVWVRHGNPSRVPEYVEEQQGLIDDVLTLYSNSLVSGMEFESQCLGVVGEYAVDIVHVPRSDEDDLAENQCSEFLNREVSHFIELDRNGNVVRIV